MRHVGILTVLSHHIRKEGNISGPESLTGVWGIKKQSVHTRISSRRQLWPVVSQWFILRENLLEVLDGAARAYDLGLVGRCSCFLKKSRLKERQQGNKGGHTKWNGFLKREEQQKSSSFGMFQHMFWIWKHCAEGRQRNKILLHSLGNVWESVCNRRTNFKSFLSFFNAVSLSLLEHKE